MVVVDNVVTSNEVTTEKRKNMPSVKNEIEKMIDDVMLERIKYNIERASSLNADISYKDTEDGKTIIYITKDGKTVENVFDNVDSEVKKGIDLAMAVRRKKQSKNAAKDAVKVRYKVGDYVLLRSKIRDGSNKVVKKFEVKKVIWSIHEHPVNILILKQFEGPNNNQSLNKDDCKKYHIKYEPGLQVYSMMLNFVKFKK